MVVGKLNGFPHIDSHLIGNQGKFVGEGDVDVPIRVLRQLDQFRCGRCGQQAFAFNGDLVKLLGALGTMGRNTTDDPIIVNKFHKHIARQYPFRAV